MKANRHNPLQQILRHPPAPTPNPKLLDAIKSQIELPHAPDSSNLPPDPKSLSNKIVRLSIWSAIAACITLSLLWLPRPQASIDLQSVIDSMQNHSFRFSGKIRTQFEHFINSPILAQLSNLDEDYPFVTYQAFVGFDSLGNIDQLRLTQGDRLHQIQYPLEAISSTHSPTRILRLNSQPNVIIPNPVEILKSWMDTQNAPHVKILPSAETNQTYLQIAEAQFAENLLDRVWIDTTLKVVQRRQLSLRTSQQKEILLMDISFDSIGTPFPPQTFDLSPSEEEMRQLGAGPALLASIQRDSLPITLSGTTGTPFEARLETTEGTTTIRGTFPQTILCKADRRSELDIRVTSNHEGDPIHIWMNHFGGTMHGQGLGAIIHSNGITLREPRRFPRTD